MFRDPLTNRFSRPGEKMIKVVTETRPQTYFRKVRDQETGKLNTVECGHGEEIVKEVGLTKEGYRLWLEAHPIKKEGESGG